MKKNLICAILILAANVAWSAAATAQSPFFTNPRSGIAFGPGSFGGYNPYNPNNFNNPNNFGGGYGGYGGSGGSVGGVGEIYSGMGNLVRAEGERDEKDSQASINYQKANQEAERARSAYIDNQQKLHYAIQTRKREGQAQRASDNEAAQATRARQQQFFEAHRPPPLSYNQFDPSNGQIQWPPALRAPDFDDLRTSTESLFEARSKYGATPDLTSQMVKATGDLKDLLRGQILTIPMSDYSTARKFLDSMAVTVQ